MKIPDKQHLQIMAECLFSASCLWALMLSGVYFERQEKVSAAVALAASTALAEVHIPATLVEAKAAIVYDAKTGKVLFSKNADEALPLASLTKIMSAQAILSVLDESTSIVITPTDLEPDGDSGLVVGDTWSLKNLLTFGLVASSNDAMAAAAAGAGTTSIVERMNSTAQTLGLSNMHFSNPTGLDVNGELAGAYGSAHDMALLVADFLHLHPALFGATVSQVTTIQAGNKEIEAAPTAEPLLDIPGLIGAKTGYTDLAGGNLVAAFDIEIGHPIVVVVLGSSRDGRFSDVRTLIEASRISAQLH